MEFSKQVFFKNWTDKDFTYKYAGEDHTFAKGGTYAMAADIALHFAQHLAERELYASGNPKDEALPQDKMTDYMNRCFPGGGIEALTEPLKFERVDIKDTEVTPAPKVEENKTESTVQNDKEEDEDVQDNKPPKFKGGKRPKAKDDEYVK